MNNNRIIPILLLKEEGLYKTYKFGSPKYIGDPVNTINIFNEKKVDELIILDISDQVKNKGPNFEILEDIASEAFFPIAYGGGIKDLDQAKKIMSLGFDKISFCSAIYNNQDLVKECVKIFGSQSVVACLDFKVEESFDIKPYINNGKQKTNWTFEDYIKAIEELNIGEIIVNDIERDGSLLGYNHYIIGKIREKIKTPIIAAGGAKSYDDISTLFSKNAVSAAAGALFVYYGPYNAVLISYPSEQEKLEIGNVRS